MRDKIKVKELLSEPVPGKNKQVVVVLLNWNGIEDTLECLSSLAASSCAPYRIIVVDNNSDDDLTVIEKQYPEVLLIKNADNYGFCKGNNIGIAAAAELGAEYCWVLNNDTVVSRDCLGYLVEVMEEDASLGAVTHRIDYYSNKNQIWFAGGIFVDGIPTHLGYFAEISNEFKQRGKTEYLTGCSFVARTELLQRIDGFDENYFCYVEDVDLSLRIRQLGYGLGYVGDAVVWHKVSRSAGRRSPTQLYYRHRNMLYYLNKFKQPAFIRLKWFISSLRVATSLVVKHRNPRGAWFLIKGLLDGMSSQMGRLNY